MRDWRIAFAWAVPLAFALSMTNGAAPEQDATIMFDFSSAHRFDGFGVQIWNPTDHPLALAGLLKDCGFQFVRLSLKPKLEPNQLQSGLSPGQLADLMLASDDARGKERLKALAMQLSGLAATVHFVV